MSKVLPFRVLTKIFILLSLSYSRSPLSTSSFYSPIRKGFIYIYICMYVYAATVPKRATFDVKGMHEIKQVRIYEGISGNLLSRGFSFFSYIFR
jgi:hypothetical protein